MNESPDGTLQRVREHARQAAVIASVDSVLGWDERTMLPPRAGGYRAEQVTYVSQLLHRHRTDAQYGDWLAELIRSPLAADRHSDAGATIYHLHRDYEKHTKLPLRLVEELARCAVLGQQAWVEARRRNDYPSFRPLLEQMLRLKREQAEALGYQDSPYDALLDDFEPGAKSRDVAVVLDGLRRELVPLVAAIADSPRRPQLDLLRRQYPQQTQETLGRDVARRIGFDFDRGRLDVTHHPFCTTLGPHDTRITTRYDERFFPSAFFGILHETGHGLYEQGLPAEQFGLPLGSAASLGIHESQSRLWENFVGRSRAFWRYCFPAAQAAFPAALGDTSLDAFYAAINDVRPSLIRVEADEATYNLHIVVRFELELALLQGELSTADLPSAWNDTYREFLGVTPPGDDQGVLQDIHWSAGLLGYFPTYALGNLYAAHFFAAAQHELGDLDQSLSAGEFQPLLAWLRERVHCHGRRYAAAELAERIGGQPLSHKPLIRHLYRRFGPLYDLAEHTD